MEFTQEQECFVSEYCDNNMKKLKQMCYPFLIKIGGISEKDYDDFYSIALEALADTMLRYDNTKECKFQTFLLGNIKRKFTTEIRDRNRQKRIPAKKIQSFDVLISDDGLPLSETIPSNVDLFKDIFEDDFSGSKIEKYMDKLSNKQKRIVALLANGYRANEIRELLCMSNKEYTQNLAAIRAYENVRELM